jgi:protein-disulfide isomerase
LAACFTRTTLSSIHGDVVQAFEREKQAWADQKAAAASAASAAADAADDKKDKKKKKEDKKLSVPGSTF